MHLADPARPQINYRPALLRGGSVVPWPSVWPLSHDLCQISVWLPYDDTFRFHKAIVATSLLPQWLERYRTDPERQLEDTFGWTEAKAKPAKRPIKQPKLDISDLIKLTP